MRILALGFILGVGLLPGWVTGATLTGSSVRPLVVSPPGRPGFTIMRPETTGVSFTNRLALERSLTNHVLLNGSGVALGDVDGDGWCDVFLAGLDGGSALYRNLGHWKFTNITSTAFAGSDRLFTLDATGTVLADLNGDGALDLLVNSVGQGTRCWRNDGTGKFREVTEESGLGGRSGGSSLALADTDGDGDLDLYVVNYRTSTIRDEFQQRFEIKVVKGRPTLVSVNGRATTEPDLVGRFSVDENGRITEHGEADTLFLNDGKGRFTAVSFTDGSFRDEAGEPLTTPPYDWGLAAQFRDLNGDRAPDLYVCNDLGSPDRIWLNDGKGGFQAIPRTAIRKTSWFSMGVDFGDLNRDGYDDFLVTDMLSQDPVQRQVDAAVRVAEAEDFMGSERRPQCARNTLFAGRGDGTFAEVAWAAGLAASDWSWSPVFLDVDLDGWEDVLISTGFERNVQDVDVAEEIEAVRQREKLSDAASLQLRRRFPSFAQPNVAFRNRGNLTFSEASREWGFEAKGISQGMALADLDQDGDLDVVINNQNAPASLLQNTASAPRLAVRLRGKSPNVQGIGARLTVTGGPVTQTQEVISGGRYASGDEPVRVFAAGMLTNRLSIQVDWRSGHRSVLTNLAPNQWVDVTEPEAGTPPTRRVPTPRPALFTDVSARLGHRHRDQFFDDFARQPLLPRSLSQLGPGVCWGDLNGDGTEDLIVGSGRGGRLGVFLNDGKGTFTADSRPIIDRPAVLDQGGLLIWPKGTNRPDLLVSFSNYEAPEAMGSVRVLDLGLGVMRLGGPRIGASIGPLARADVQGDGVADLFVGGRVIPGRYPEPASSALFRGGPDGLVPDVENTSRLARLGLVTAAVFSDLDNDSDPDLVVACEWGPLQVFFNEEGRLQERELPLRWDSEGHPGTLRELTGWWQGITTVDLDGDGRLDLVAANWGRNTRYGSGAAGELRIYSGDFDANGTVDLLETQFDPGSGRELPLVLRSRLAEAWPSILERFPTRRAFGSASVGEILVNPRPATLRLGARTLDSMVFLNRGDHFQARPLPPAAQYSPTFGVVAADFDGDGAEDVFLSQNFFGTGPETDRDDAGQGLLLRGDGQGGLEPVTAERSGLRLPGEQRGAAVADFDADGRVDLVVTQNRELTQLYRNAGAKPGLRVRLAGPPENPTGVGVQLRLAYSEARLGPVREIHAGSGYWSQDSPVAVLGKSGSPQGLWVRWPGQAAQTILVAPAATEVTVTAP